MKRTTVRAGIWDFVKQISLMDAAIFVVVGLVCVIGGWRTWHQFGDGLILAGAGAILLGLLSLRGSLYSTRTFDYLMGESIGPNDLPDRTEQRIGNVKQSYGFLIEMTITGTLPILVGSLFQALGQ